MKITSVSAIALPAILTTAGLADTITVCASGCDHSSLTQAILAAQDGDVIELAAETYTHLTQFETSGKAITIRGTTDADGLPTSILDGQGTHRVFACRQGETETTVLENLVFRNGRSLTSGGGLNLFLTSPTLINCTFLDNHATVDGGALVNTATPVLIGCRFIGNTAGGNGDGIFNATNDAIPTLIDCTFAECCQVDPIASFVDGGGNDYEPFCIDCRGNVDCRNDAVDAEDLGYLLARWGSVDAQCDIDGDGLVGAADLGLLFVDWGPCD